MSFASKLTEPNESQTEDKKNSKNEIGIPVVKHQIHFLFHTCITDTVQQGKEEICKKWIWSFVLKCTVKARKMKHFS